MPIVERDIFLCNMKRIPIYSYNEEQWREVNPEAYFNVIDDESLSQKRGAIYDIVLTESICLENTEIRPVNHPKCIPGKCSGMGEGKGKAILRDIAKDELTEWLLKNKEYRRLLKKFSVLQEAKYVLPDPEYEDMMRK